MWCVARAFGTVIGSQLAEFVAKSLVMDTACEAAPRFGENDQKCCSCSARLPSRGVAARGWLKRRLRHDGRVQSDHSQLTTHRSRRS